MLKQSIKSFKMNLNENLKTLWDKEYIQELPEFIKNRGFVFSENNSEKDILITGINPSFREEIDQIAKHPGYSLKHALDNCKKDNYWRPINKMLFNESTNLDLRNQTAYVDIFYFREMSQQKIKKELLKNPMGIHFLVDQLQITQKLIEEVIKPKVIIVKNRESAAYWGKHADKGLIWMGYSFKLIESYEYGDLYIIEGLLDSNERICQDIKTTNLKGTLVLFSQHINQYTKREKRPTVEAINNILKMYS